MPSDVVILSCGLMTPVGLSSEETIASVRAGTARFIASGVRDQRFEPFMVAEVPGAGLPPLVEKLEAERLTTREAKLLRLATSPLTKALAAAPRAPARVPLFVALPEQETLIPLDSARFLSLLGRQVACVEPKGSRADFRGRAGGLLAAGAAATAIAEGKMPFALAGGVDSFLDLHVLATLDMERRIKSEVNLDGFVPGEGAAFVLLASGTAAAGLGIKPMAKITPAAPGAEAGHLHSKEAYRGEGLAETLAQLFAGTALPAPVGAVYASMNGESHWGKEWGVASIRNRKFLAPAARVIHPADSWGDIGAAAGPAMVALAAHGMSGGYRPHPSLVYCSNDRAPRAALLVMVA